MYKKNPFNEITMTKDGKIVSTYSHIKKLAITRHKSGKKGHITLHFDIATRGIITSEMEKEAMKYLNGGKNTGCVATAEEMGRFWKENWNKGKDPVIAVSIK